MIIDLARRAHDHNWEMDPITRSLLDTDFYKLLMLQFIWKHFPSTHATYTLINRTTSVRLGEIVSVAQLREQLEITRKLRFRKSELVWLAGNSFFGRRGIFEPAFLDWLENDFRLSDFELSVRDGQLHLRFEGLWSGTSMWEIYALAQIGELKTRAALKHLSELELDILYVRAKTRLWEKLERLRGVPNLSIRYTAPASMPASGTDTVTAKGPGGGGTAAVTLLPKLTISPAAVTVTLGSTQQFSAGNATTWSATAGAVTSAGFYTAPTVMTASGKDTVTATGPGDPAAPSSLCKTTRRRPSNH